MEIATAAVSSLLPKLASLLQKEYMLQKRVKQEIVFLEKELEMLKAAVLRASEMGEHHPADDLSRKLQELSYDTEDSLDKFKIRVEREHRFFDKLAARHTIAKRIDDIKSRAKELSARYARYKINNPSFPVEASKTTQRTVSRASSLQADASTLVGVDRPRDELITQLKILNGNEEETEWTARLKVVSIVGIGGIGKTTLAKEVYHKIQESFPCRAWVSVSRNPNMENILMGLLRQVEDPHSRGAVDGNDERDLIRRIKKSLQGKRFLLVFDDIWNTKTWEVIKLALPLDSCGSRIITTTRIEAVAAACSSDWNGYIYQVIPLSSKDSWKLFCRGIGSSGSFPSHLEDVSDKILERCSGVPLALITMSRLLANKPTREDAYRYISATPVAIQEMRNILLLSYNDLPRHVKVCFLYLSIFPEDYPISYDHIIRCWIAEGFVSDNDLRTPKEERNPKKNPEEVGDPMGTLEEVNSITEEIGDPKRTSEEVGNHTRTLEEIGESYLTELINRSMIQPVRGRYDVKPEYFQIHSLVLDLIKYISVSNDFVTLLNNEESPSVLHSKVRRLSIVNINEYHDILPSMNISHIRSLYIFGGVGMKLTFKKLHFLRVLNLEGCKDLQNHTIKEIPGLLSLRYLSIRDAPISELPNQIELQPQGIQLNSRCYLSRIPEWLTSLSSLRYVSIDIEEVKNEDLQLLGKLCFLLHLSLLSKIVPTEKLVIGSKGFQGLRVFHLYSARADLTFEPQAMQNLEKLLLSIHVLPEEIFDFSICQFKCLKKIDIRIDGRDAYASKLFEAANISIRKAADKHPNHPMVNIIMLGMDIPAKEGNEKEKEMELKEVN
ncbi:unnamed protein product [Urochloa humidicola]